MTPEIAAKLVDLSEQLDQVLALLATSDNPRICFDLANTVRNARGDISAEIVRVENEIA